MEWDGFFCPEPPLTGCIHRVSLRIMQLDIRAETKTADNVFVMVRLFLMINHGGWLAVS